MKKRWLFLLIALLLVLSLCPEASLAADGTISSDGTYYLSAYGSGSTVTIGAGLTVTLKGESTEYTNLKIVCSGANTKLTLDNVLINDSDNSYVCALSFSGAGNTLTLAGENSLKSGFTTAGIQVSSGTELAISGSGSISTRGGFYCAGIGGSFGNTGGTINIVGGDITACGGENGAGIDGQRYGEHYRRNGARDGRQKRRRGHRKRVSLQ